MYFVYSTTDISAYSSRLSAIEAALPALLQEAKAQSDDVDAFIEAYESSVRSIVTTDSGFLMHPLSTMPKHTVHDELNLFLRAPATSY
jgi:hypothetical protein